MSNLTKEEFVHVLRRQSTGFPRGSSKFRGVTLHKCGRWEARMGQFLGKKYIFYIFYIYLYICICGSIMFFLLHNGFLFLLFLLLLWWTFFPMDVQVCVFGSIWYRNWSSQVCLYSFFSSWISHGCKRR